MKDQKVRYLIKGEKVMEKRDGLIKRERERKKERKRREKGQRSPGRFYFIASKCGFAFNQNLICERRYPDHRKIIRYI